MWNCSVFGLIIQVHAHCLNPAVARAYWREQWKCLPCQPSMLLWSQHCYRSHCHWSEGTRDSAKEGKEDGVNENAHHWAFSWWCFAPSASFVVKWTTYHVHMRELTVIDSVFMCGVLLVGGGQTWLQYALHRWSLYAESNTCCILLVLTVILGFPLSGCNVEVTA